MSYVAPDTEDSSDQARRARAVAAQRRRVLDALYAIGSVLRAVDRGFVVRLRQSDLTALSEADRNRLGRLVWTQRRMLPAELRPKLPPFDPIVRQMEAACG